MTSRRVPEAMAAALAAGAALLAMIWLGTLALAARAIRRALGRAPRVRAGDPYLAESLHSHQYDKR